MDDLNNNNVDTSTTESNTNAGEEVSTNTNKELVSFTLEELQNDDRVKKLIQSAEDRVRTKYSNDIKSIKADYSAQVDALNAEITQLKPVQKSEKEIELENKEIELLKKERAIQYREKGIGDELANFLATDADIDAVSAELDKYFESRYSAKMSDNGYKPMNMTSGGSGVSQTDLKSMSYKQRLALYTENPEMYKALNERT